MFRNMSTQENTVSTGNVEAQTPFEVTITEHNPQSGVLASAEVKVADIMTIRNVKIKQDDYGLTVTMPRTRMPYTEQYKDSVYFSERTMKEQFDKAVEKAYRESIPALVPEQDQPEEDMEPEETGTMGMEM